MSAPPEVKGAEIRTMSTLIKYTMSKDVAELVRERFEEMGFSGEDPSYLDCVIFDAALGVLGIEQAYYGLSDEEWAETVKSREDGDKRFNTIKIIDITDTWREVLS